MQPKSNPPRKHPRNARVVSAKELGTMSKNNLKRITLARGPIWGIHSLILIISCQKPVLLVKYLPKYSTKCSLVQKSKKRDACLKHIPFIEYYEDAYQMLLL